MRYSTNSRPQIPLPAPDFKVAEPSTFKALLFMVAATAALSGMHGLIRHLSVSVDVYTITFMRNLFGLLAVLPLVLRNGTGSLRTKNLPLHLLRGVSGILAMVLWFTALARVEIATATALSFSAAIFGTIAAVLILRERVRARRIVAITVGFIGVIIVLRPAGSSFNPSALLVLVSSLFWGFNLVIVKTLANTERTASIVAWSGITLTVLSLPLFILFGETPSGNELLQLVLVGALGTLGHLCMTTALSMADATAVMSLDFLRLLWTVIIGVVFFAEYIDAMTLLGAVVIFASSLYIIFREARPRA